MSEGRSLYETDFVRWSEEQAAAIRAASTCETNLPLDWENLAEEIESLGRSDRRELKKRLRTLIEHLLKLECSSAKEPRTGWKITVQRTRTEIEDLVSESPSLKAGLAEDISNAQNDAAKLAARELEGHGEPTAALHARLGGGGYAVEQLLQDWWPEETSA